MEQLRDISNHNGTLTKQDFVNWKAQGVVGVYLKVTEGRTFVDALAPQFRQWASEVGLLYGEYHFFHPDVDSYLQVDWFLQHSHTDAELVPALDLEVDDKQNDSVIRFGAITWLSHVGAERNCLPLLYTYPSFATRLVGLQKFPLWISDPDRKGDPLGPRIAPWKEYALWQDDTHVLDKDALTAQGLEPILVSKGKVPAATLRAKTGYFAWVAWRLGEGAWKGWGRANLAVRPNVPRAISNAWWGRLEAFLFARS